MRAALEVQALRKRFGSVVALDGLELVAPEGDVLALLGPNGAGKTTLVRALATQLVCVDAVRALVLGGSSTGPALGTLAWLAGLLAIFVPLSVRRYGALE